MTLDHWLIALAVAVCLLGSGIAIGRQHPAKAALDENHNRDVEKAYDDGWEDATNSAIPKHHFDEIYDDPGAGLLYDERAYVVTDAQPGAGAWLDQYDQLAPDTERQVSHTDQFAALGWPQMPWKDREGLIEWDFRVKSDRMLEEFDQWRQEFMASWKADIDSRLGIGQGRAA